MSSSAKLRLAGRQPSHRGGVLRMRTWRDHTVSASAGSSTRVQTGQDRRQVTSEIFRTDRTGHRPVGAAAWIRRRHVDLRRVASALCPTR